MMSKWDERLHDHQVHTLLGQLQTELAGISAPADPPYAADTVDRARAVTELARAAVNAADARFVSQTMLDQLAAALINLYNRTSAYKQALDPQYLDPVGNDSDQVVDSLATWPQPPATARLELAKKDLDAVSASAGRVLDDLTARVTEVQTRVDEAEQGLTRLSEERDQKVGELGQQIATLSTTIDEQRTQVQSIATEFQGQFSTSQEGRLSAFDSFLAEQRDAAQVLLSNFDLEGKVFAADSAERAENLVSDLGRLRDEAARLVGVVGSTGTAGGYQILANDQKRQADKLRWLALLLGALAVVVTVFSLVDHRDGNDFEWGRSAEKAAIALALGGLATYAARQSSLHRDREEVARKVELEFASIDPYLVQLPDQQRDEIKAAIALRLFAQPLNPEERGRVGHRRRDGIGAGQAFELLQQLVAKMPNQ